VESLPTLPNLPPISGDLNGPLLELERKLRFLQPASAAPSAAVTVQQKDVGDQIIQILATDFDKVRGQEWELFAQGLGSNLEERDRVRILPGEIDRIEREQPDTRKRLRAVLTLFRNRCSKCAVNQDLISIIIETLKDTKVFGNSTFNRTARNIRDASNQ